MDAPLSMNTLRIVLVGMTAVAALVAAAFGSWFVAGVLTVSVVFHGLLWVWLAKQRRAEADRLHEDVEALLREQV